jgi:hypothetical protein
VVHSDRSCDGGQSSSRDLGDFPDSDMPVSTTFIEPKQNEPPKKVEFKEEVSSSSEDDSSIEHAQNLAVALRLFLVSDGAIKL